jgi:hypothetical protein
MELGDAPGRLRHVLVLPHDDWQPPRGTQLQLGVRVPVDDGVKLRPPPLRVRLGAWKCSGHRCQKQPWTWTAMRLPRSTTSARRRRDVPAGVASTRKRSPSACSSRRRDSSGAVSRRPLRCSARRAAGLLAGGAGASTTGRHGPASAMLSSTLTHASPSLGTSVASGKVTIPPWTAASSWPRWSASSPTSRHSCLRSFTRNPSIGKWPSTHTASCWA